MLNGPFTISEALAAGLTREQLRSKRWNAPFRGVYQPRETPPTLAAQCQALARLLPPEAAFTGITAARLRSWWLPAGATSAPLHITVPPDRLITRPGVRSTRRVLDESDVIDVGGLRVTSGLRTLRDLAADWSLIDLVMMADAALRFGHCTSNEWAVAAALSGGRGVCTLRRATTLTDARSESPMETVLRLLIVIPGLPAPLLQAILRDECGGWLAQVDLLAPDGLSVLEYDGASHETGARHDSDVRRWRMLRRHGFEVFPYTKRDLFFGWRQILTDYQTALGLPDDPRAAQAWLREWERSSFRRRRS
jgi:hypothetical protein